MPSGTRGQPPQTEAEARRLVAEALRIQYHLGLVDYLGHSSIRLPDDRMVIKPKSSTTTTALGSVSPDDLMVVGLDGEVLSGTEIPPAELWIHTEIYKRRPDVQAVVHTHQPAATLMGVLEAPILPLLHVQSPVVKQPMPTWACPLLVTDTELGGELAAALGQHKACHLQGHGIVSVATTLQEATVQAIHLEQLAEISYKALAAGQQPRVITETEITTLESQLNPVAARWAYYLGLADGVTRT